jgi:hypothetical protein
MRKTITVALAGLAALSLAGLALAHGGDRERATGLKAAAATLTATTVTSAETRSCTATDGAYEIAKATYTGTLASTDATIAGPATLHVKSVYNTTTKLGYVDGWLKVRDADGKVHAKLFAVNSNGTLDGYVAGVNGGRALLASLSATFSAAGGFADGQIGQGSATNLGLLKGKVDCKSAKPAGVSVRLKVRGTVDSIADGKIGVKPADGSAVQVCAIDGSSDGLRNVDSGDVVEIECVLKGGAMTLAKVRLKGDGGRDGRKHD